MNNSIEKICVHYPLMDTTNIKSFMRYEITFIHNG